MLNLGLRIRELREVRHVAVTETGVSRGHLSRIECNRMAPALATLERLSEKFGMGLEVLLGSDERFYAALILEDDFTAAVIPFLKRLSEEQKKLILRTLEAAPKLALNRRGRRRQSCDPIDSLILNRYRESIASRDSATPSRT